MQCSTKTPPQLARKRLPVWLLYPYANRDKIKHNKQANKVLFPCVDTLNLFKFWHGGQLFINHLNYIGMCKIKQLNGDAPKYNNYCTSREYEVFCMIAKDDNFKVGDLIDGEKLTNKTVGRIWEITECNRTDGGHVTIKDNKGNIKTCMFVFGKGTQKPQPKPQPQQTTKET